MLSPKRNFPCVPSSLQAIPLSELEELEINSFLILFVYVCTPESKVVASIAILTEACNLLARSFLSLLLVSIDISSLTEPITEAVVFTSAF